VSKRACNLCRERYKPPSWLTPVPQTCHLSNADVTVFVESMLPIVLVAMFSKGLRHDVAVAFQHLSSLRPEIVIPPLLEQ
jgi:proteasome activator subunit 4